MPEIKVIHDDITKVHVDAVVNAANTQMRGGGGVDGAIHRAGGPTVLEDCVRRFPDGLAVGDAGYTTAGELPAHWVINTVEPDYTRRHRDRGLLESCYRRSLGVADELGVDSVAFPLISAGTYGWPIEDAIAAAIDTVRATSTRVKSAFLVVADEKLVRAIADYRRCVTPFRILEAVGDLHQRGYESVRVLPYISPSGISGGWKSARQLKEPKPTAAWAQLATLRWWDTAPVPTRNLRTDMLTVRRPCELSAI